MISETMKTFVGGKSAIRDMFDEGCRLKSIYGDDKVYDFSLGNPNLAAPEEVKEAIIDIVNNEDPVFVHGYMANAGYPDVRKKIADSLNRRFDTKFTEKNIVMTVGAASGLNVALKLFLDPGDNVLTFAPYFVEYGGYVRNYGATLGVVPANTETFQPNLKEFEARINEKTRVVIINSPHNPTGVVYSEETIKAIADILYKKEEEYGKPIVLISDEPYRELAYDGVFVPYVTKYYKNTIVGYSYSKSLSLPGERIGYIVIPDELQDADEAITAANAATRVMGYVNAPSLMQRVIGRCVDAKVDLAYYEKNKNDLYNGITQCGFKCTEPQGAFYLWVKSPVEDDWEFCNTAKKYNIIMVPGTAFACPGYVRLAYCVSNETIHNSLPAFKKLAEEYSL